MKDFWKATPRPGPMTISVPFERPMAIKEIEITDPGIGDWIFLPWFSEELADMGFRSTDRWRIIGVDILNRPNRFQSHDGCTVFSVEY